MSKFYEVRVLAIKTVLVEVEDDDETPDETAMNIAGNEAFDGCFDDVSVSESNLTGQKLEASKRHADVKVLL